MQYDFDKVTDRRGTNSLKYDFAAERGMPEGILPLWVADMDFPVADEITQSLEKVVRHGIYGYSEAKDSYFQAVADWMRREHGWQVEKRWLVKTPGVVYALAAAIRAFTEPGDGVLIQNPVYYPFGEVIRGNDRALVDNTLLEKDGKYTMDLEDFERKVRENHVKLFLLCNPHNPVGRVWTREELLQAGEICHKHGVLVVSDEIHHDFVYPGNRHFVFAALDGRFQEMTVTCTAPSKTFNLAGLQVSNIFIPNGELRKRFKREVDRTGYSQLNTFGLAACESAYRYGGEWLEQLKGYLKGNLDFTREYLAENIPGIRLVEPEGTYLVWLDCRGLGLSARELDRAVVEKAGLWLDGGSMFGECGAGFQRINIACPRATLREALGRLKKLLL